MCLESVLSSEYNSFNEEEKNYLSKQMVTNDACRLLWEHTWLNKPNLREARLVRLEATCERPFRYVQPVNIGTKYCHLQSSHLGTIQLHFQKKSQKYFIIFQVYN